MGLRTITLFIPFPYETYLIYFQLLNIIQKVFPDIIVCIFCGWISISLGRMSRIKEALLAEARRTVVSPKFMYPPPSCLVIGSFSFSSLHPCLSFVSYFYLFSSDRAQSVLSIVLLSKVPSCERHYEKSLVLGRHSRCEASHCMPQARPAPSGLEGMPLECPFVVLFCDILWSMSSFEKTQICQETKRREGQEMVTLGWSGEGKTEKEVNKWTSVQLFGQLHSAGLFLEQASSTWLWLFPHSWPHDQASHMA